MATARLRKRPFQVIKKEDITPDQLERINGHFDDRIRELDLRQISQTDPLATTATLDDVIAAYNALVAKLNASDLTED